MMQRNGNLFHLNLKELPFFAETHEETHNK